jgi:hypothetical protein
VNPSPKGEAAHLLKLAKELSVEREELIAGLIWESLRFVYFTGQMPEFWRLTAEKKRPSTARSRFDFDFLLRHKGFPIRWNTLSFNRREGIKSRLVGDQSKGARILDASEAIQSPVLAHFTEWFEKQIETIDEGGSIAPKCFRREDGGVELVLVINPHCGWDKIADSLKVELCEIGVSQFGRRNRSDIAEHCTKLKGLAALWLREANFTKPQINKEVFPAQGEKRDYCLLNEAENRAKAFIKGLLSQLDSACSEWSASKTEAARLDGEMVARIEQGIRRGKRKKA